MDTMALHDGPVPSLTLGAIEHGSMALHDSPVPCLTLGAIEHDPMDPMMIAQYLVSTWGL